MDRSADRRAGGRYRAGVGVDHDRRLRSTSAPLRLGIRTAVLLAVVLGGLAAIGALDPVQLLLPGEKGAGGALLVEDFGADRIPDGYSYDGQQYYLAARSFPDIDAASEVVGGPRFRLLRILLPALASVGGQGTAVVLLLVAWNIVGVGIAVGALADVAQRYGRPPIVGAAAAVALALPLVLTTGECLAFGLGFLALSFADRNRTGWAVATLAVAGLTRETALTFGVGVLACWFSRRRWRAVASLPAAVAPLVAWRAYLHATIDDRTDAPLGVLDVLRIADRPLVDLVLTTLVVLAGAYAVYHWRDVLLFWPVAVAFLGWLLVYEYDTFDRRALPRVSAPLLALGLAGAMRQLEPSSGSPGVDGAPREQVEPGLR
jgi:hypothetical protein